MVSAGGGFSCISFLILGFTQTGNLYNRSCISGTSCWFRHSVTVAISSVSSKWARSLMLLPAHGAISSTGSCSERLQTVQFVPRCTDLFFIVASLTDP